MHLPALETVWSCCIKTDNVTPPTETSGGEERPGWQSQKGHISWECHRAAGAPQTHRDASLRWSAQTLTLKGADSTKHCRLSSAETLQTAVSLIIHFLFVLYHSKVLPNRDFTDTRLTLHFPLLIFSEFGREERADETWSRRIEWSEVIKQPGRWCSGDGRRPVIRVPLWLLHATATASLPANYSN